MWRNSPGTKEKPALRLIIIGTSYYILRSVTCGLFACRCWIMLVVWHNEDAATCRTRTKEERTRVLSRHKVCTQLAGRSAFAFCLLLRCLQQEPRHDFWISYTQLDTIYVEKENTINKLICGGDVLKIKQLTYNKHSKQCRQNSK
jgi:hypothetical protein